MAGFAAEYLKHGKALCGKVFSSFVETFNWHNDFLLNLKGDADVSPEEGLISVDRSDPSHPVIRFSGDSSGGSGGKTIKSTDVSADESGSTIVFHYTDGTSDTFFVQAGQDGEDGEDGEDGTTPEITAEESAEEVRLYADGELVATIPIGGSDTVNVVTGLSFQITDNKLVCKPKMQQIKAVKLGDEYDGEAIDVCDAKEVDVVVSENYDESTRKFTNTKNTITVLKAEDAGGDEVFEATPHSSEGS